MQRTACTRLGMINLDVSLAASNSVGVNLPFALSLWYSSTARHHNCLTTMTMTTTRYSSRHMWCSGLGPASSSNVMHNSALPSLQVEAMDRAIYQAHAMPSAVWFVVVTASLCCCTSYSGSQSSSECPATTAADTTISYGLYDTCEVETHTNRRVGTIAAFACGKSSALLSLPMIYTAPGTETSAWMSHLVMSTWRTPTDWYTTTQQSPMQACHWAPEER